VAWKEKAKIMPANQDSFLEKASMISTQSEREQAEKERPF
jgi:hypothetical protein